MARLENDSIPKPSDLNDTYCFGAGWSELRHELCGKSTMKQSNGAFTIVELLIVIVVIAILAAISVVAYNGIQTRAKASAITETLRESKQALLRHAITGSSSIWWDELDFNSCGGRTLRDGDNGSHNGLKGMKEGCGIDELPALDQTTSLGYGYDNDGDSVTGWVCAEWCEYLVTGTDMNSTVYEAVDNVVDGAVSNCGNITYDSGINVLFYHIASNENNLNL